MAEARVEGGKTDVAQGLQGDERSLDVAWTLGSLGPGLSPGRDDAVRAGGSLASLAGVSSQFKPRRWHVPGKWLSVQDYNITELLFPHLKSGNNYLRSM